MSDIENAKKKFQKELKAGTVALVLLGVLEASDEPMYGYQITKHIEGIPGSWQDLKMGALYPVLRSLERSGILASEVEPSVSGPPRKYYRITETGRDVFGEWKSTWNSTSDFVNTVLKG